MAKDQKFNNRSQGQRIRRSNENVSGLVERMEKQDAVNESVEARLAQHDRDIKVLRSMVFAEPRINNF